MIGNKKCNKGFGFEGKCLTDIKEMISSKVPKSFKRTYDQYLSPLIEKATSNMDGCSGDYQPNNENLEKYNCNKIGFANNNKFGAVAFNIGNLTRPDSTDLTFCTMFDRCGSVGLALNASELKCMAAATGVGAIVSTAADFVEFASIAMCPNKKVVRAVTLPIFN